MLTVAGIRMRRSFAVVMVGVAASLTVSVAVVSAVFHIMLNAAGMPIRRSVAAVMVGVAASVTVTALIAVGAWPTTKTWFAADAMVGATIWMVRLSLAAVPPPGPEMTSCSESAAEPAMKLVYWSAHTMS